MEQKEPSFIPHNSINVIPQREISLSNEMKWKMVNKKYFHIYNETKTYSTYSNILDDDGDKIIKILLKFYFDGKQLDHTLKSVSESILSLMKTIEIGSDKLDKNEFLVRIDSLMDYIKEYGTE